MKSLIYGYNKTGKSFERYLKKNNQLDFEIYDLNNLRQSDDEIIAWGKFNS